MLFDYSLSPKTFFLEVSQNTFFMIFCGSSSPKEISLRQTCLGSKSSQNASIFHEKNDGGVKKYPGCPYTAIHEVAKIPKVLSFSYTTSIL